MEVDAAHDYQALLLQLLLAVLLGLVGGGRAAKVVARADHRAGLLEAHHVVGAVRLQVPLLLLIPPTSYLHVQWSLLLLIQLLLRGYLALQVPEHRYRVELLAEARDRRFMAVGLCGFWRAALEYLGDGAFLDDPARSKKEPAAG